MVPVGAVLTGWWPLSPLGFLFHTIRSSSVAFQIASDGQSSLPDSISIYVGVSGSWPIDHKSIRFCHINIWWQIIWYSTQFHPVTIGSCPYLQCNIIPTMYRIGLACNSVTIQLRAAQFINHCRMFMSSFGKKTNMGNPPYLILPPYMLEFQNPDPEI